jgi:hypothetical protein
MCPVDGAAAWSATIAMAGDGGGGDRCYGHGHGSPFQGSQSLHEQARAVVVLLRAWMHTCRAF